MDVLPEFVLPEFVSCSPMTLLCPKCHAQPGDVCEVMLDEGLEIVHVERIKAAVAVDFIAKERSLRPTELPLKL